MTDQPPSPPPPPNPAPVPRNPMEPAVIINILYIAGFFVPMAALGGLVYAYVERGKDPALDSHLDFHIQTFWWGLLMLVVGTILLFVLVGIVVFLFWFVWTVVRIITGLSLAQRHQPISGVELFGMKAI